MNCTPRCPCCKKPSSTPHAGSSHVWYCHHCKMPFEDQDDGDVGYGNPEKYATRKEAFQQRQKQRQRFARVSR